VKNPMGGEKQNKGTWRDNPSVIQKKTHLRKKKQRERKEYEEEEKIRIAKEVV